MAEEGAMEPVETETETVTHADARDHRGRNLALTIVKWIGIALAVLLLLIVLAVVGLNTGPGRNFAVKQINNLELASGLDINVDRIDGSLYGDMTLVGLTLRDPKGVFATSPSVRVDWRPFHFVTQNLLDVHTLSSPQVRLMRLPELNPSEDEGGPLLPGFDIDVDKLDIRQSDLGAAGGGQAQHRRACGQRGDQGSGRQAEAGCQHAPPSGAGGWRRHPRQSGCRAGPEPARHRSRSQRPGRRIGRQLQQHRAAHSRAAEGFGRLEEDGMDVCSPIWAGTVSLQSIWRRATARSASRGTPIPAC